MLRLVQRQNARGGIQEGHRAGDVVCRVVPSAEMGGVVVRHREAGAGPVDAEAGGVRVGLNSVLGVEAKTAMWIGLTGPVPECSLDEKAKG